ncbi:MAG: MarR family winged helix-turn-helix transcriptional regulator [Acidimicrobiales bacterium]
MPKATSPSEPGAATLSEEQLSAVASSMSTLSRAFTLSRPHEQLTKAAGVRLDRAGSVLLFRLRLHGGPARVSDLAEILDVDAPAVTRKIQQLERLGYLSSAPDTEDKRAKRITLTTSGEKTLQRIMLAANQRLARLFEGWSEEEVARFSSSLDRFANAITEEMENDRD